MDSCQVSDGLGFADAEDISFEEYLFVMQPLEEAVGLSLVLEVVKCFVAVYDASK